MRAASPIIDSASSSRIGAAVCVPPRRGRGRGAAINQSGLPAGVAAVEAAATAATPGTSKSLQASPKLSTKVKEKRVSDGAAAAAATAGGVEPVHVEREFLLEQVGSGGRGVHLGLNRRGRLRRHRHDRIEPVEFRKHCLDEGRFGFRQFELRQHGLRQRGLRQHGLRQHGFCEYCFRPHRLVGHRCRGHGFGSYQLHRNRLERGRRRNGVEERLLHDRNPGVLGGGRDDQRFDRLRFRERRVRRRMPDPRVR